LGIVGNDRLDDRDFLLILEAYESYPLFQAAFAVAEKLHL
jgi:hypothetical protein